MIKAVNIKTTIPEYKKNVKNQGKIAIYDIDTSTVIYEGTENDWSKMQDEVEKHNAVNEVYHLIIVPHGFRTL